MKTLILIISFLFLNQAQGKKKKKNIVKEIGIEKSKNLKLTQKILLF